MYWRKTSDFRKYQIDILFQTGCLTKIMWVVLHISTI